MARKGCRVSDIGHAVQAYVEANGFSVVRDFVGHGVGAKLHEAPEVRNFGPAGHGPRLLPGMTIAVEPMVMRRRLAGEGAAPTVDHRVPGRLPDRPL